MPTRKFTSPTGKTIEAEIIDIEEITDRPVIVKLSDGSILRLRVDVVEVCRSDDEWDQEGNPLYHVKSGNIISIIECPEHLKKSEKPIQ